MRETFASAGCNLTRSSARNVYNDNIVVFDRRNISTVWRKNRIDITRAGKYKQTPILNTNNKDFAGVRNEYFLSVFGNLETGEAFPR